MFAKDIESDHWQEMGQNHFLTQIVNVFDAL